MPLVTLNDFLGGHRGHPMHSEYRHECHLDGTLILLVCEWCDLVHPVDVIPGGVEEVTRAPRHPR